MLHSSVSIKVNGGYKGHHIIVLEESEFKTVRMKLLLVILFVLGCQLVASEGNASGNNGDLVAEESSNGSPQGSYLPPVGSTEPSAPVTEVPATYLPPQGSTPAAPTQTSPTDSYGTPGSPNESYGPPSEGGYPSNENNKPSEVYGTPGARQPSHTLGDGPSSLYGAPGTPPSAGYGSPQIISSDIVPGTTGGLSQVPAFDFDDSVTINNPSQDLVAALPEDSYSPVIPVRESTEGFNTPSSSGVSNGLYGPPSNTYLPPINGGGSPQAPNPGYLPPTNNGGVGPQAPNPGYLPPNNGGSNGGYGGGNGGHQGGNNGGYGGPSLGNNGGYSGNQVRNNGGYAGNQGGYGGNHIGNNNNVRQGGYNNRVNTNNRIPNNGGYNNGGGRNVGGYNNAPGRNAGYNAPRNGGYATPNNNFRNNAGGSRAAPQRAYPVPQYRQPVRNVGYVNQRSFGAPRGGYA